MIERILIVGTGLLGASTGLALRTHGYAGEVIGWDRDAVALETAVRLGALTSGTQEPLIAAKAADLIVLAGPVFAIVEWMERLAEVLSPNQLVTDVGSTKQLITETAAQHYNRPGRAAFLPGHPMAGKESGGAMLAEASLFQNAMWLFTPLSAEPTPLEKEWRMLVSLFGTRTLDMDPARHDEMCAWVSHLPQMLSTALAALLEERFGDAPEIAAIGGRALRETTRLGASPYSMWRDIAMTNTGSIADTLLALEQRLTHVRENLRTPELREEFLLANKFRVRRQ